MARPRRFTALEEQEIGIECDDLMDAFATLDALHKQRRRRRKSKKPIRLKRPKGRRQRVIEAGAKKHRISPALVELIWKRWRRKKKRGEVLPELEPQRNARLLNRLFAYYR